MKTINYSIIFALFLVLFVVGCSKPTTTQATGNNPTIPADNAQSTPRLNTLAGIYDFARLTSFAYRINTKVGDSWQASDYAYTIKSENFRDADVWVQEGTAAAQGGTVTTKMWIDKTTNKCINYQSTFTMNGQTLDQPGQCPNVGPYAQNDATELTSLGTEELDSPLGKLTATKYSLSGITYWVAPNIPVPIQIIYNDGTTKMVLTAYT
jgi:hypothetical protein